MWPGRAGGFLVGGGQLAAINCCRPLTRVMSFPLLVGRFGAQSNDPERAHALAACGRPVGAIHSLRAP